MYEDTDGDRALTADDKRVIFYFDNQALSSRGCYDIPVNGTCSDSVNLDQIAYLWSANDWLAKISNSNFVGGGSLPGQSLPGFALAIAADDPDALARRLRTAPDTPVFGRIDEGRVLIELRTIAPEDDDKLVATIRHAVAAI